MLTKLDRYILTELWLPFMSGAGIITGVWLGIDKFKEVFKLLAKSGAAFSTGIVVLGLEIPQILATTIPIGILLATFLTFQKLSSQSEVIAIRAAGASFTRMMRPVFLAGLFCVLITFMLSEFVVPLSTPFARKIYTIALYKDPISMKDVRGFSYFEKDSKGVIQRIFYVRKFRDNLLRHVVILDFSKKNLSLIHTAKRAKWDPVKGGWILYDGSSSYIQAEDKKDPDTSSMHLVSNFETTLIPSSLNPNEILKKMTKSNDLNFYGLWKMINLHEAGEILTDKLNDYKTRFHSKFAYPFSCILLALIGACMGITGRRRAVNWGYIALGLVVFVFYMSHTVFDSFGDSGRMAASLAAWFPNIIIGLIAWIAFFYRANK
ncbi:MAG: LptF/LptG family permease [Candidatus Melainabacteria bacterium]|nr:LptF/LptG family permease [Candidatus Melainabacteria bacterium]